MSQITFQDVSFSYSEHSKSPVLSDISLSIEKGTFVSIIGPNGSGKSTFSRLLNGILLPTEGKVLIDGMDTKERKSLREIRRRVGVVFQNPDNQIVSDSVEDDVAFAPENLGLSRDEITRRVEKSLEMVGLLDKRYRSPNELSGGEKARLSMAGILAMDPDVLVLDEVTAMLDEKGRRNILDILLKLKEKGKTIIFITHHTDETLLGDRILVIKDGRLIQDDTPRAVFSDPLEDDIPLPFVSRLSLLLSKKGIHDIDGAVTLDDIRKSPGGASC